MVEPSYGQHTSARRSLDGLFTQSARTFPDRPALIVHDQPWTYRELDTECKALEEQLQSAGLRGSGNRVGLIYAKSVFSYAAVIAVMRSNCVYVPVNPKAPAGRLLEVFKDAGVAALILDETAPLTPEVVEAIRRSTVHAIIRRQRPAAAPARLSNLSIDSSSLAYIIYTSGSTGEPKGVAVSHASACSCMEKLQRLWGTSATDRFTQFSPLSFDYSLVELFVCWKSGGELCVPSTAEALVPLNFAIARNVTVWFSVPSLASFLLKLGLLRPGVAPQIRISLFGGEALPLELVHAWADAAPNSRLMNLYGPTEVTIVSTYFEIGRTRTSHGGTVPIGDPLPGVSCTVMDEGRPVALDEGAGELWLAGEQLAMGYWNNRTATDAAFVHAPDGQRWYRTGDLVRRRGRGFSYLGRVDRQVKLRGQRVELQEVEAALREMLGCSMVAVVPIMTRDGICERVVAYCDELNDSESSIKVRCRTRIAAYMVPDRILKLQTFPLNLHGKIDYRALAQRAVEHLFDPVFTTIGDKK